MNKFFEKPHYNFGERQPQKTVERKDSIEPDGRHKIELSLSFDNEEAKKAVLRFIAEVNSLHEVESLGDLEANTTWLRGYLAALLIAEVIDEEQTEQLIDLLKIASRQQTRLIKARR